MAALLGTTCSSKEMAPAKTEVNERGENSGRGENSPRSSAIQKLFPSVRR